jgi:hypothetical protein
MTQVGKKPTEPKPTGTDWERVKREAAQDVPVSFDPAADADRELYDPNDARRRGCVLEWCDHQARRGEGVNMHNPAHPGELLSG